MSSNFCCATVGHCLTNRTMTMQNNDFDAMTVRVATLRASMPKRLAQAAGYALAHPEDMALGTAASIAQAADVQPSTLVRLAHHLGYDGFSDLQSVFRDRLKSRSSNYEERLERIEIGLSTDTYEGELLNGFIGAARQSLEAMVQAINPQKFAKLVDLLAPAETIYLVGKRRSYPLTAHMAYAFGKLGIRAVMVNSANDIDAEIISTAKPGDAAIICSFSPYAPNTIALANLLAERNVPIAAITDSALSPLCTVSKAWLEISEHDFAGFRSLSASMAVVAALPVAIAERRRQRRDGKL